MMCSSYFMLMIVWMFMMLKFDMLIYYHVWMHFIYAICDDT